MLVGDPLEQIPVVRRRSAFRQESSRSPVAESMSMSTMPLVGSSSTRDVGLLEQRISISCRRLALAAGQLTHPCRVGRAENPSCPTVAPGEFTPSTMYPVQSRPITLAHQVVGDLVELADCWSSIASRTVLRLTRPPSGDDGAGDEGPAGPTSRRHWPRRCRCVRRVRCAIRLRAEPVCRRTTPTPSSEVDDVLAQPGGGQPASSTVLRQRRHVGRSAGWRPRCGTSVWSARARRDAARRALAHQVLPLDLGAAAAIRSRSPAAAIRRSRRRRLDDPPHAPPRSWSPPVEEPRSGSPATDRRRCRGHRFLEVLGQPGDAPMSRWLVGSSSAITSQSPMSSAASWTSASLPPESGDDRSLPVDVGHQAVDHVAQSGVARPFVFRVGRRPRVAAHGAFPNEGVGSGPGRPPGGRRRRR